MKTWGPNGIHWLRCVHIPCLRFKFTSLVLTPVFSILGHLNNSSNSVRLRFHKVPQFHKVLISRPVCMCRCYNIGGDSVRFRFKRFYSVRFPSSQVINSRTLPCQCFKMSQNMPRSCEQKLQTQDNRKSDILEIEACCWRFIAPSPFARLLSYWYSRLNLPNNMPFS